MAHRKQRNCENILTYSCQSAHKKGMIKQHNTQHTNTSKQADRQASKQTNKKWPGSSSDREFPFALVTSSISTWHSEMVYYLVIRSFKPTLKYIFSGIVGSSCLRSKYLLHRTCYMLQLWNNNAHSNTHSHFAHSLLLIILHHWLWGRGSMCWHRQLDWGAPRKNQNQIEQRPNNLYFQSIKTVTQYGWLLSWFLCGLSTSNFSGCAPKRWNIGQLASPWGYSDRAFRTAGLNLGMGWVVIGAFAWSWMSFDSSNEWT